MLQKTTIEGNANVKANQIDSQKKVPNSRRFFKSGTVVRPASKPENAVGETETDLNTSSYMTEEFLRSFIIRLL